MKSGGNNVRPRLTNALFKEIIFILQNRIRHIRKKQDLRNPNDKKQKLDGLIVFYLKGDYDKTCSEPNPAAKMQNPDKILSLCLKKIMADIYLDASLNPNKMGRILIHEILHFLMIFAWEKSIDSLSIQIWKNLNPKQKKL